MINHMVDLRKGGASAPAPTSIPIDDTIRRGGGCADGRMGRSRRPRTNAQYEYPQIINWNSETNPIVGLGKGGASAPTPIHHHPRPYVDPHRLPDL